MNVRCINLSLIHVQLLLSLLHSAVTKRPNMQIVKQAFDAVAHGGRMFQRTGVMAEEACLLVVTK